MQRRGRAAVHAWLACVLARLDFVILVRREGKEMADTPMPGEQQTLREFLDKQAIRELVRLERFWRDQLEWDKLASAYTEDSVVHVSWFKGTGREFAEASRREHARGIQSKHLIFPTEVRVRGDRALVESPAQLHLRGELGGVEYDLTAHIRFFSRVRRTAAGWRLVTFDAIYVKDSILPVNPSERLNVDDEKLRHARPSYRLLAYTAASRGHQIDPELLGDDHPEALRTFYRDAERWLETGA
jgi:hypothetical protein